MQCLPSVGDVLAAAAQGSLLGQRLLMALCRRCSAVPQHIAGCRVAGSPGTRLQFQGYVCVSQVSCAERSTGPAAATLLPGNAAKGDSTWYQTFAGPGQGGELCPGTRGSALHCRTRPPPRGCHATSTPTCFAARSGVCWVSPGCPESSVALCAGSQQPQATGSWQGFGRRVSCRHCAVSWPCLNSPWKRWLCLTATTPDCSRGEQGAVGWPATWALPSCRCLRLTPSCQGSALGPG